MTGQPRDNPDEPDSADVLDLDTPLVDTTPPDILDLEDETALAEGASAFTIRARVARQRSLDRRRFWLGLLLLSPFPLVTILPIILLAFNAVSADEMVDVLPLIISPVVAVVGAITGFYFGERSADSGDSPDA